MGKKKLIRCAACGHDNDPGLAKKRCAGCGAPLQPSNRPSTGADARYNDRPFSFAWLGIAVVVIAVLTAAIIVGLPMAVALFDFEGSAGSVLAIPVWFCGGVLVGLISPEKTFAEPTVATFIVAMPTVMYLIESETVKTQPVFMYLLYGALGVLFALVGAYAGERLQIGAHSKKR